MKAEDEQQLYYADIAEYQLDEGITTRLITGSALVATWATFESAVQRAAGILGQPRESILNKSKKLFERLGIQHPVQINDLYALRNALAHTNGRLDDISLDNTDDRLRKRIEIERLANSSPGLKTSHDGYLIVSIEFVVRTFKCIEPLLLELAEQTDRERASKQSG